MELLVSKKVIKEIRDQRDRSNTGGKQFVIYPRISISNQVEEYLWQRVNTDGNFIKFVTRAEDCETFRNASVSYCVYSQQYTIVKKRFKTLPTVLENWCQFMNCQGGTIHQVMQWADGASYNDLSEFTTGMNDCLLTDVHNFDKLLCKLLNKPCASKEG